MKIFVTSDLHFGHNKPFIYEPRGFKNIQDHDRAIVENWNKVVSPEDTVYVLGDLMLNDNVNGAKLLHQLNGKLCIILGNHDTDTRIQIYNLSYNVELIEYGLPIKINKQPFFLSHYPTITDNYDIDKPLKNRIINLCGHSHIKDPFADFDKGLIYHCELDAHNMTPIPIEKILDDIKGKLGKKF